MFLFLTVVMEVYTYFKTYKILYCRCMQFIVCQLDLNNMFLKGLKIYVPNKQ